MSRVYIIGGLRSHFGIRYGIFKTVRPEVLGGKVLLELSQEETRTYFFAAMRWDREVI